jgi:antitoxin MazE
MVIHCYNNVFGGIVVKRLTKHGNSLALVIEKGVLDLLEIGADTPLAVTTDGTCLIVAPVRDRGRKRRFQEALEEGNRKYARTLRRLA